MTVRPFDAAAAASAPVTIVGGGAVGLTMALRFARNRQRVVLLERGGTGFREAGTDGQTVSGTFHRGVAEYGIGLGGSTNYWAGQCMHFGTGDLTERPWVSGSGWPIRVAEVRRFYAPAEEMLGVTGYPFGDDVWARVGTPDPLADADDLQTETSIYCPEPQIWKIISKDKQFVEFVDVFTGVRVHSLVGGERAITALDCRTDAGRVELPVRRVVLAASAMENARILLTPSESNPQGVGNEHDLVGRYLQDHPNGRIGRFETWSPAVQAAYSLRYARGRKLLPKIAPTLELQEREGILNFGALPTFDFGAGSVQARVKEAATLIAGRRFSSKEQGGRLRPSDAWRVADIAMQRLRGRSTRETPETVWLHCFLEQEPNPESRVTLGDEVGADGVPALRVHWEYGEAERRTAVAAVEAVAKVFSANGFGSVVPLPQLDSPADWNARLNDNNHHAGTTRMATTAAEGVVDTDCLVHGRENVWCAGGSVFPTSGYANPTLTMVAMGIRLADHLITAR